MIVQLENKLVFYVSDVSGHELRSSMVNIFLKETIDSYLLHCQNKCLSPSQILDYVNDRFNNENFPADIFITLVIGVIELDNFKVSLSNAGFQFPALVTQKEGGVSSFVCKGMPITVINRNFAYEECCYNLNSGDIIHINTDGLIEQTDNKGNRYGEDRLLQILTQNTALSPEQILKKVYHDFYKFKGDKPIQDDLTSLLIQRN